MNEENCKQIYKEVFKSEIEEMKKSSIKTAYEEIKGPYGESVIKVKDQDWEEITHHLTNRNYHWDVERSHSPELIVSGKDVGIIVVLLLGLNFDVLSFDNYDIKHKQIKEVKK